MNISWKSVLMGGIIIASLTGCGTAANNPSSSTSSESMILEIISLFEMQANERNVEGTMTLFAENAVVEETYQGVIYDGTDEIEGLWRNYYRDSPPCEFRDIVVGKKNTTFVWAELGEIVTTLWPVVIEVKDGKITYMDFYEDATKEYK